MGKLKDDVTLVLDDAICESLITNRIREREEKIKANDANRRALRATAGSAEQTKAIADKATAETNATNFKAAFDAQATFAKAAHSITDTAEEELFDPLQGHLILKANKTVLVQGQTWPDKKRISLSDKDCDDSAAAYLALCTANDEAVNILRKINEYQKAHPPILGEPGTSIPEPQELLDLRALLESKTQIVRTNQEILGAITYNAIKDEKDYDGIRHDIVTGEIVLVSKPK